jgi:hypothetical protein
MSTTSESRCSRQQMMVHREEMAMIYPLLMLIWPVFSFTHCVSETCSNIAHAMLSCPSSCLLVLSAEIFLISGGEARIWPRTQAKWAGAIGGPWVVVITWHNTCKSAISTLTEIFSLFHLLTVFILFYFFYFFSAWTLPPDYYFCKLFH